MLETYDHRGERRDPGVGVYSFVEDAERLDPGALQNPRSWPEPLWDLRRLRGERELPDPHVVVWLGSVYMEYFMGLRRPSEDPSFPPERERDARRAMLRGLERTQLPVLVTLLHADDRAPGERSFLDALAPSSWHYLEVHPRPPGTPALLLPDFDIDAVQKPEWRFIRYASAVRKSELTDLTEVFSVTHLPELIVI